MTLLHAPDTLVDLVDAEHPAVQDWATARVALYAPDRYTRFPTDGASHDPVLAAAPPALVDSLIRALVAGPCSAELAAAAAALGAFGAEPDPAGPIVAALRAAEPEDDEAALWLAHGLAQRRAARPSDLARAAAAESPFSPWLLPSVLLTVADSMGALDDAAAEVAQQIPADAAPLALTALATPVVFAPELDLDAVVELGATHGNMRLSPTLPPLKGSRRRRMSAAVQALVDGIPGPGPALLRALAAHRRLDELGMWTVATAARLAVYAPGDAFGDVLLYEAGADPAVLTRARGEVGEDDVEALQEAVPDRSDCGVLALEVLTADLAARIITRLKQRPSDLRQRGVAIVAASRFPALVPPLLTDPATRMVGLELAAWCPTEAVLEGLLGMPVPHDEGQQGQHLHALAATGEPAALERLEALQGLVEHPALGTALELSRAILGR